jgi:hypothetical protein
LLASVADSLELAEMSPRRPRLHDVRDRLNVRLRSWGRRHSRVASPDSNRKAPGRGPSARRGRAGAEREDRVPARVARGQEEVGRSDDLGGSATARSR